MQRNLWLRQGIAAAAVLFCATVLASHTHGAAIRLAELIATDGKIVHGDKEFSDFEYLATGNMPTAEDVNVAMFTDEDGNFGLRFQGGFLDVPDPQNQASDALISYRVRVTDPQRLISDAYLASNLVARDGGSATITETFLPIYPSTAEVLRIPTSTQQLIDSVVFDQPQRELVVQKNILMRAASSQVDMSFVDQTFSQVPEPAALTLLSCGIATAAWAGRAKTRRSNSKRPNSSDSKG